MNKQKIKVKDSEITYYEWGNIEKPPIICIHGMAGNALYSFSELAGCLAKDFHVIAFDNPGHGETSSFTSEEEYSFSHLANWYHEVFHLVLDTPFYLLGHSWGADIVLHYSKYHPEHVKGLILLDGGFTFPQNQDMTFSEVYAGWGEYIEGAKYLTLIEAYKEFRGYTNHWSNQKEQAVSTIFKKNQQNQYELITSKFTALSIIKAFFNEPFADTYPYIKAPVLLIHAVIPKELDEARKRGISQMQNHIQEVTVVRMDNTHHNVQWDEPELISKEINIWSKKGVY
ncbi:pimeloyl-ACP methyl ester carboxylesterase [Peribacillus deserti]|uniref:Pimeloyl-ACP methyl ester carboxylesterase n=1 Tax=Peribacillus deserti TaxID=673318 RepID=A0ABS2QL50_9BACI|nr:alpha/beta hydrolase [Peribacillus deserti]MBM7693902.1 pimeloyl-ACP methyl ester carboxylesterase [Peribacillus deserti]